MTGLGPMRSESMPPNTEHDDLTRCKPTQSKGMPQIGIPSLPAFLRRNRSLEAPRLKSPTGMRKAIKSLGGLPGFFLDESALPDTSTTPKKITDTAMAPGIAVSQKILRNSRPAQRSRATAIR